MKLQYVTPTSKFSFPNPTPPPPSHLISSTVPTPHYNAHQKISNITPTMSEIMDSSRAQNLHLQLQTLGPFFRITAKSLQTQVELGRAEGLIRVWLGGRILHLDSIRLKRETIGMEKSIFGIGLFLGAVAIRYGYDSGCRTAELLAINDSDLYHSKLVKFYTRIGFKAVHEVTGSSMGDLAHMLVWGGVGTRMDADIEELLVRWCLTILRSYEEEEEEEEDDDDSMSRREGRDSDSKRHRFKYDRERSPKRSRRDGKPETERTSSSLNANNGDHVDHDQKHRRRLQDALPLEAPLASDSKEENEAVSKESDRKNSGPRDRTKPSSDALRHRSFFQHDERDSSRQVGRRFSHRPNTERGWWGNSKEQHGERDSKDQHCERVANMTVTDDTLKRDEKSEAQGTDKNHTWRHDGFFEMESNPPPPPPPRKRRPAFREKKMPPLDHEIADKVTTEAVVKPSHPDRPPPSERGSRNHRHTDGRPEKLFSGDGALALPSRGEAWRGGSGGPAPRYGSSRGGGNYRERERERERDRDRDKDRDRFGGRQGQGQRSGDVHVRVEKWKHDLFDEANRSPIRKKEEEQIAKVEALLAS